MVKQGRKAAIKYLFMLFMTMVFIADCTMAVSAKTEAADKSGAAGIDFTGAGSPTNPVHYCTQKNDGSDYTDWSYVYFGSYPQSEVMGNALTTAITGADYDTNGDTWVNGIKYRRISKSDTNTDKYFGDSAYRYFKWERIKWRVLKNNGSMLFVAADKGLDCKDYHDPGGNVTWESSTIRTWLNRDFYQTAFSSNEQNAIVPQNIVNKDNSQYGTKGGNNTSDKVFLLSIEEVTNQEYGFCGNSVTNSVSRRVQASDYAHARGAYVSTSTDYAGNCWWWLRSPGSRTSYAAIVTDGGYVSRDGLTVYNYVDACVPALHINLSSDLWSQTDDGTSGSGGIDPVIPSVIGPESQNIREETSVTFQVTASGGNPSVYTYQWYYAASQNGVGKRISGAASSSYTIPAENMTAALSGRYYYCVVSNGVYEVTSDRAKLTVIESEPNTPAGTPANPVHHCTQEDDGSDYTEWSYVYFGSYPQSEVTGNELTTAITGADYDTNGDAWVNGIKYRRISKSDTNYNGYFGDSTYRYFKWERIKWKVLKNNGSTLFVVADKGLDCNDYHKNISVTWENSAIRSWLNDDFYQTAFSSNEQNAITQQNVVNEDNLEYGMEGGNDTQDNVYLLSIKEAENPEYGFCENYSTYSASRRVKASDYAHVMGADVTMGKDYAGSCFWWLRSPGYDTHYAADVNNNGSVNSHGSRVSIRTIACVPALHINLSSDLWSRTDDGTSGSGGIVPILPTVSSPESQSVESGTSAVFRVTASSGNPNVYTYQWYYAESETGTGARISGATSASYTIFADRMTTALNGRYYYCVVSNGIYEVASERARLTVQSNGSSAETHTPPTVSGLLEWYTAEAGTSLELTVTASGGNPSNYTYQWYYAASESETGTKINGAISSKYVIPASEMTLSINNRYYYCIVSNGSYNVESRRTRIFVYNETNPGSGTGGNGASTSAQIIYASSYIKEYGSKAFFIEASTNGNGKLTYQSGNKKVAEVSSNGQVKLKGYGIAVVTIWASQTQEYKAASKQITIEVIPKKIELKKVGSPGSRRISIKWKKGKKIKGYELYISSSKNFKSNTFRRGFGQSKTNTALAGLKSGKKYYVKIRSYAKVGKKKYYSEWSKIKQVKIK